MSVKKAQQTADASVRGGTVFNTQTGAAYTPTLADGAYEGSQGALLLMTSASPQTITIPPNSNVAYPVGTCISAVQMGVGKVTFATGAGVTINSSGGYKSISSQYSGVTLTQVAINVWLLIGALTA